MGIMDRIKGQFIEVIEWTDDSRDTLVWRFPVYAKEIKNGAQLTVRDSQLAVFVNEGEVADVFVPGRYQLVTQNLPILTTLKSWKYGFNSPFKAEVYFINTRQFTDQKWGTSSAISIRDSEYGEVDIRAFGSYSYRCSTPETARTLMKEIVGTSGHFKVEDINGQLRSQLISSFTDSVAESKTAFIDMAAKLDELSKEVSNRIAKDFKELGLELTKFIIQNVSVPEEIQEIRRQRMKMKMLGAQNYQQFVMGESMVASANNPAGGAMGIGLGAGAGMAMGNQMMGAWQQPQQQAPPPMAPPPLPQQSPFYASINGAQAGPFDLNAFRQYAGAGQITKDTLVWRQGMAGWTKAGDVPDLASVFAPAGPPPLPPPLPPPMP